MAVAIKDPSDIVGRRFGYLTVSSFILKTPYHYGKDQKRLRHDYRYLCRCDCGATAEVLRTNLQSKHTMSCGCERKPSGAKSARWTGFSEISGAYWGRLQRGAASRDIPFRLSIQEAWEVFLRQQRRCALTGEPICLGKGQTASVDRIDSSGPYELSNVQWLHKDVNKMKMDTTTEKFVALCRLVARHNDVRGLP
jgi:hypothetical protein